MIDTEELGAGSYPCNVRDENYKCYEFEVEVSSKMKGYIYAKSEDEAKELVLEGKNDDISETYDVKVENIIKIVDIKDEI